MIHLNIDQATDKSGFSIYSDDKLIDYKFFNLSDILNKPTTEERIDFVKNLMIKIIDEFKVELVIFEDIFLNTFKGKYSNYNSFKVLAMLLGVLQNETYRRNMLYFTVKPSEWRSSCQIKGSGGIQKQGAIDFVKKKFNIDVEEDVAESICIGWHTAKKILPKIKIK